MDQSHTTALWGNQDLQDVVGGGIPDRDERPSGRGDEGHISYLPQRTRDSGAAHIVLVYYILIGTVKA